jgi:phosphotransferase system enzyme I (PtsI)
MTRLNGLGVSPGIAIGTAVHLEWRGKHVFRVEIKEGDAEREIKRLHRAIRQAKNQLATIKRRIQRALGKDHAYILDAHLLMLEDQGVIGEIETLIRSNRVNAEWAVKVVTDRILTVYSEIKDDYLRERGSDIEDVAHRLLTALGGARASRYRPLPTGSVLLSEDLPPSVLAELDLSCVVGFATSVGGWTSHTAIIARSLGIPAVVGLHMAISRVEGHQQIVIDGSTGQVIVSPTPDVVREYQEQQRQHERRWRWLRERLDLPATTRDGVFITLRANVELLSELDEIKRYGANGVGLFRSEYLFLQSAPDVPSEETQFETYKRVAEAAGSEGAAIRTVDWDENRMAVVGGPSTFPERNPALGLRAIRFSLQAQEIFKTQLRAIVRAARYGNLQIVLPLISSLDELKQCRQILDSVKQELSSEGVAAADVPLGIMIEVPAAVLIADLLAVEADFFSLGTNDLIQYVLAVDRDNDRVAHIYEPLHPAVLRALKHTIRAAEDAGIGVEVCGEMASNPLQSLILLGLGVRALSMRPRAIPLIKELIRSVSVQEIAPAIEEALRCVTADEVRRCLSKRLATIVPETLAEASLVIGVGAAARTGTDES